jgi:hypothetical protein
MGYPRTALRAFRLTLLAVAIMLSASAGRPAAAAYALLKWTSPSDGAAQVSRYDLRISTKGIAGTDTLGWWNAATKINMDGKIPAMPGTVESLLLGGLLDGAKYYAILKSADAQLNWSGYSNVATFNALTSITGVTDNAPAPEMVLGVPRPTPTSGRAEVDLDLPRSMEVDAGIFDAQGRLVRTLEHGTLSAGRHLLSWDGRRNSGGDVASGVYWIRAAVGALNRRVKLVVVR